MADQSDKEAQETLIGLGLGQQGSGWSRFLLPVVLLLLIGLCAVLSFVKQPWAQRQTAPPSAVARIAPRLVLVPATAATPAAYIKVQPGLDDRDDLFYCTKVSTDTCPNLTQSPAVAEVWPVLDAADQDVAYYGVNEGKTELFLLSLTNPADWRPLTVRSGDSKLHTDFEISLAAAPAFSPNGDWVAFLAQAVKGSEVELFVARADGQEVRRVTYLSHQVCDYAWLDDWTMIVAVWRTDEILEYSKALLNFDPPKVEPLGKH